MAFFGTNTETQFAEFDLWSTVDPLTEQEAVLNLPTTLDFDQLPGLPTTYSFDDALYFWAGDPLRENATSFLSVYGENITVNASGQATAGTVTGLIAGVYDATLDEDVYFYLVGISVSVLDLQLAASTTDTSDDLMLFVAALAGDDYILGGPVAMLWAA